MALPQLWASLSRRLPSAAAKKQPTRSEGNQHERGRLGHGLDGGHAAAAAVVAVNEIGVVAAVHGIPRTPGPDLKGSAAEVGEEAGAAGVVAAHDGEEVFRGEVEGPGSEGGGGPNLQGVARVADSADIDCVGRE